MGVAVRVRVVEGVGVAVRVVEVVVEGVPLGVSLGVMEGVPLGVVVAVAVSVAIGEAEAEAEAVELKDWVAVVMRARLVMEVPSESVMLVRTFWVTSEVFTPRREAQAVDTSELVPRVPSVRRVFKVEAVSVVP